MFVLFPREQLEWEFFIRKWKVDGAEQVENDSRVKALRSGRSGSSTNMERLAVSERRTLMPRKEE